MSNLAEGIFEKGYKEGYKIGYERGYKEEYEKIRHNIVENMLKKGMDDDIIMQVCKLSESELQEIKDSIFASV